MMKRKLIAGFLAGAFLVAQCLTGLTGVAAGPAVNEKTNLGAVVAGNTEFATEFYKKISETKPDENAFFSPYSLSTALAMTYAGARENTAKQMADTLRFRLAQTELHPGFAELDAAMKSNGKGYRLEIANALWVQQGFHFRQDFVDLVKANYGGGFTPVDFSGQTENSRQTINSWVEKKTAGKIKELLSQGVLTSLTRLVLTNAIYFKGDWASKFKAEMTKQAPFYTKSGEAINVPTMHQNGQFKFSETDDMKLLAMPYAGDELSMVVLLPKKSIDEFEKTMDLGRLDEWLAGAGKKEVDVYLPKFKFETAYSLNDVLANMGMKDAFSASFANFSGMTGKPDLYITSVIHKAVIDVNEEGSEAAAATAVVMGLKSVMYKPEFKADRPFVFLIRHNATGSVLFLGRVMKPEYK